MHMRPFATSGHLRLTSIMYKVCNRCRKANRTCRGYKDETDLIFRHHRHGLDHFRDHSDSQDEQGPPSDDPKTHIPSVAHYTTADWRNATFEREAREQFLLDYSVISSDRSLSRGYLEGLRQLLVYCGPSSELSQAVTIVSFASYANKHSRPEISAEAKYLYFQLLQSFQRTISNVATSNIVEPLLTAVLLGLYEIISTTEAYPSAHSAHSKGVSAILTSEHSPFDIFAGAKLFQMSNPLRLDPARLENSRNHGILCAPLLADSVQSLDSIMVRTRPIAARMQQLIKSPTDMTAEELGQLREDMILLVRDYAQWAENQPPEWSPKLIGTMNQSQARSAGTIYWPGRLESYFDLYVAGIWNCYRKSRLLFLDQVIRCELQFPEPDRKLTVGRLYSEVQTLAADLAASVHFHLTGSAEMPPSSPHGVITPGKSVGGLLILHPLTVSSTLSVVSPEMQTHFRNCLAWIGDNMGIGQATLLAKNPGGLPYNFIKDGHVLVWAGMLVSQI
ncbi:hypothetical protein, variant [Exophiala xenobiotica]|uniref:Zn(2)-C6 fungal-type domain-containing protein n=1 Tax=Exophiala xenobiotica TaxID=348802 RepID=A0A0D2FLC0_9EURO|nr:hypothetical protein, variant [Exophiala xenobiotica]KIW60934.1 hypothetical protein, variant [Exophiala xenobiotica]